MTAVDIEYCVPCGHRQRALDVANHLLETFGQELDDVSLVTGDGGVFKISVDGDLVFDKSEDEYDLDAITSDVQARV